MRGRVMRDAHDFDLACFFILKFIRIRPAGKGSVEFASTAV
jgi:hypothetical protein